MFEPENTMDDRLKEERYRNEYLKSAALINSLSVWRSTTLILVSVLITIVGAWISFGRNAVQEDKLQGLIQLYSVPEVQANQARLETINLNVARLQDQVAQLQADLAGVAQKLGVPAKPVSIK